jgi:NADH-quinone oxidoreductase subunit M
VPTVNDLGFPILTIILFLPAAGSLLLLVLPEQSRTWSSIKLAALAIAVADFALSLVMLLKFQTSGSLNPGPSPINWHLQFAERQPWIPGLGINYFLAVDGISVWLVPLTTTLMLLALFAASFMINRRVKHFMMLMLVAETGVLGIFLSWNLFLFYVFWETMLIPTYFLIGMWGEAHRVYATTKFVIYTVFGSFLMLVAIFYLYANSINHNLDVDSLIMHPLSSGQQTWLFLAFMLAFAIKVPLWPFHTWAPTAYVEAPVPVTVLLSSILSKTGAFGVIRLCLPIFPHAAHEFSVLLSILAVIGLLYAATIALVQWDAKRTMAYASISHMNLILLGIFVLNQQGIDGAILQMVNHGMILAGLFFMTAMVYARSGTRRLDEMSGLARAFPVLAAFLLLLFLAGMDLPGLGSFAGEFTILIGVFLSNAYLASVAALITIMAAWYMVRWFQGIVHGPYSIPVLEPQAASTSASNSTPLSGSLESDSADQTTVYEYPVRQPRVQRDLQPLEMALLVPIAAVIIWLGVQPKPVTDRTAPTVTQLTFVVHQGPPTISSSAAPPPVIHSHLGNRVPDRGPIAQPLQPTTRHTKEQKQHAPTKAKS